MDNNEHENSLNNRMENIQIATEINEILNETHDYYGYNYDSDDNDGDSESDQNPDNDNEWDDWREDCEIDELCICLFCNHSANITDLKQHLSDRHQFNFDAIIIDKQFYSRIKLINYIRRSVRDFRCHRCQQCFDSDEELWNHFDGSTHSGEVPETSVWDLDKFLIPIIPNDNLLHFLHSDNDEQSDDNNV